MADTSCLDRSINLFQFLLLQPQQYSGVAGSNFDHYTSASLIFLCREAIRFVSWARIERPGSRNHRSGHTMIVHLHTPDRVVSVSDLCWKHRDVHRTQNHLRSTGELIHCWWIPTRELERHRINLDAPRRAFHLNDAIGWPSLGPHGAENVHRFHSLNLQTFGHGLVLIITSHVLADHSDEFNWNLHMAIGHFGIYFCP